MVDETVEGTDVEDSGESEETLHEALTAAFDEVDAAAGSEDNDGGGHAAEGGTDDAGAEGGTSQADGAADEGSSAFSGSEGDEAGLAPPMDWDAELRESWKDLPAKVQEKVAAREQHMAQTMQGTAQARQLADQFGGVANRYGSVMAAEGVQNPVQMFDTVMQTVSELRMGTTQQKANKIAQLIQNYGVDIETLDSALAGTISGEPAAQSGNPDMEAMIDQRMQPVNEMMQQLAYMQQQKQYASQNEAAQEVEAFKAKAEFLNDVRHDVADLIDLATKQGRQMTLQEAYDKACAMNPQISGVLSQRAEQAKLVETRNTIGAKRNAGSSIRPGNAGANTKRSGTLLDDLNAAWDEQIGR